MNLNDIKNFVNRLDNNNFNKQDLREVINYLSLIDKNYNLVNNNYVQIKREKFSLKIPELPVVREKKINNNININKNQIKNNNQNLKKEKNIVIDQNFILKLTDKFIKLYPKYKKIKNEVYNILVDYFVNKYPTQK